MVHSGQSTSLKGLEHEQCKVISSPIGGRLGNHRGIDRDDTETKTGKGINNKKTPSGSQSKQRSQTPRKREVLVRSPCPFGELGAELLEILRSQIGHQTVASELVQNPFADSKVIVEHALRQIVCVESDFLRCQEAIRQFPHGHAAGVGGCRPWDSTGLQIVLHVQILPARRFGVRPSPEVVEFAFDFLRPLPLACGNKGKSGYGFLGVLLAMFIALGCRPRLTILGSEENSLFYRLECVAQLVEQRTFNP